MHADVTNYITKSIVPNMKSISNFTIIFALIFATNGTFSLIDGFNDHTEEKRTDVYEYILSFFITIGFIAIIFLALFGVYYSEVVLKLFTPQYDISWFVDNLSKIIGFVSFPLFYFLLLALFYWVGTAKISRFRQSLPGAFFTTIVFVITTYFFAVYVSKFARYNVLYGSIGSIILLMVWVNLNVILLLLGNELNIAIRKLRIEKILADEMKHEVEEYHQEIENLPEASSEHTIKLDSDKKS
jgi:membrane protein